MLASGIGFWSLSFRVKRVGIRVCGLGIRGLGFKV